VERTDADLDAMRERALALTSELGLDAGTWYVRMLEETKTEGVTADLGALVRTYWELQRVTGRPDLREEGRALAAVLWQGDAA
jgi:hypothetical protein